MFFVYVTKSKNEKTKDTWDDAVFIGVQTKELCFSETVHVLR
jgi:hypothetical protein